MCGTSTLLDSPLLPNRRGAGVPRARPWELGGLVMFLGTLPECSGWVWNAASSSKSREEEVQAGGLGEVSATDLRRLWAGKAHTPP